MGCTWTADGEVEFLATPEDPVDLKDIDLIVIDEASMINKALFKVIDELVPANIKILFVGDPYQLPPIGEDRSVTMDITRQTLLTEIIRNKNEILEQILEVKGTIGVFGKSLEVKTRPLNGSSATAKVYKIPQTLVKRESGRIIEELVSSNKLLDSNYFKIIAWRNETVLNWNHLVRNFLWGSSQSELWLPGDRCVIASPIKEDLTEGRTVATVDDEGVIIDLEVCTHPVYQEVKVFTMSIALDDKASIKAYVIHPEGLMPYKSILNEKLLTAKRDRTKWPSFYNFKNSFNDVRHGYAITAHRSQGSTYNQVLVDMSDILLNRNRVEALKCLYVAMSRPTDRLIIV